MAGNRWDKFLLLSAESFPKPNPAQGGQVALAAASFCVGALRKEPLMPPPASPSVTTGHLGWSRAGAGTRDMP